MYDVYQIMAGDTIDAIANKFGTNSSVIRQLNPNSGFGVGSMIVVPVTNQYFDIYNDQLLICNPDYQSLHCNCQIRFGNYHHQIDHFGY